MKKVYFSLKRIFILLVCLTALAMLAAVYAPPFVPVEKPIAKRISEPLSRDQEIELALSAAPLHLREESTVYVLEGGKYVKVREGTNGFHCLVVRFGNIIAPYAYDKEGSETLMLADFRRAELVEQGKSIQEAERILQEEYKAGKLQAPRKPGVAYMLSSDFVRRDPKTGDETQVFPPHVMFYAPYMKNSDIGALPEQVSSTEHVYVLNEGRPDALFIIVPKSNPAAPK